MSDGKTIWSDAQRARHFVIPDDAALPVGDFALRTITGRQKQVDPDAVAPFEVSEEEAVEWLKSQLGQAVEDAKGAIMDSIREKMAVEPDLDAWFDRDRTKDPPRRARPSQAPPAAGPANRLRADPAALADGMGRLVAEIEGLLQDAVSPGEAGPQAAQARIDRVDAVLRQYGVSTGPWSGVLVERVRDLHRSVLNTPDPARSAEGLEAIADGLEAAARVAAAGLRTLAQQVREPNDRGPEEPMSEPPATPSAAGPAAKSPQEDKDG